jgi:hypothetical protein
VDLQSALSRGLAVLRPHEETKTMENENRNFQGWPGIRQTFGDILPGGVVYDLVQSRSACGVELVRWEAENYEIGPQFKEGEVIYTPGYVHSSVIEATRLAGGPAEYGDAIKLFWNVADLFCHYLGLLREHAIFLVQVAFASWLPDLGARPVTICISGPNMDQIMKLFRMFHVFARRPLMVAQLSPRLPLLFHPTLLINASPISASEGQFWRTSNYSRAFIPGPRGTMCNIACSKLIFCERESAGRAWAPEAIHIGLVPTRQELPSLTELKEAQLAGEYHPQLLMFRLRNLSLAYQSDGSSRQSTFVGFAAGGSLPASIAEHPEIRKALTPLLEAHEHDLLAIRALDPHLAIVEAIWGAAHKEKETSVVDLTKLVNALLRDRGEILEYNVNEIGWKLANLRLARRHNGKRKVVRFTREMHRRIHQLATQFGLQLSKVTDCDDCKGTQLVGQE